MNRAKERRTLKWCALFTAATAAVLTGCAGWPKPAGAPRVGLNRPTVGSESPAQLADGEATAEPLSDPPASRSEQYTQWLAGTPAPRVTPAPGVAAAATAEPSAVPSSPGSVPRPRSAELPDPPVLVALQPPTSLRPGPAAATDPRAAGSLAMAQATRHQPPAPGTVPRRERPGAIVAAGPPPVTLGPIDSTPRGEALATSPVSNDQPGTMSAPTAQPPLLISQSPAVNEVELPPALAEAPPAIGSPPPLATPVAPPAMASSDPPIEPPAAPAPASGPPNMTSADPRPPAMAAAGDQGLEQMRDLIARSQARLATIQSYQLHLTGIERVGGVVQPEERVVLSIQREPRAIRLEWKEGPSVGREVLYLAGGPMHIKMPNPLLPRISMSVDSPLARRNSRHPINEAGLDHIVDQLAVTVNTHLAGQASDETLVYVPPAALVPGGPPCHKLVRTQADGEVWVVAIDAQTLFPCEVEARAGNGEILEQYRFENVQVNPPDLALATAFDPDQRWGPPKGLFGRLARASEEAAAHPPESQPTVRQ